MFTLQNGTAVTRPRPVMRFVTQAVTVAAMAAVAVVVGPGVAHAAAPPAAGTVYVADSGLNKLIAVAPDGSQSTIAGSDDWVAVAVDGAGDVYAASAFGGALVKVAPDGTQTTIATDLSAAGGVAVDPAGDVYVAEFGRPVFPPTVLKIAPDGTRTTLGSGWSDPEGLTLDRAGNLYVTDGSVLGSTVVQIAPDGAQTTVVTGLSLPRGVAVDSAGNLYVADSNDPQVQKIAPDGTRTGIGHFSDPWDVVVDRLGDLFVTDLDGSSVYEVTPDGTQTAIGGGWSLPHGVAVYEPPEPQAITFTSSAPTDAAAGDTYTITATGGGSGNPVVFLTDPRSTGCTVTPTGHVSFTAPGTCRIDATQAGNNYYTAAPTVQQKITVHKAAQVVTFTSSPPVPAIPATLYTPTATGGGSGNPIVFTVSAASAPYCSIAGDGTVTFFARHGHCVITASQAGNAAYMRGSAKQTVVVHIS